MAINTRIGIDVNLPTGATYDLLLIDHPDGYPEGKIEFKFDDTPRKITGIQKVAQFFLKTLLTRRGTNVLNPGFGTQFADLTINANRTSVDRDLQIAISGEILDAERQCKSLLNTIEADDASRLSKVSLLGLDVAREAVTMYLQIATDAGTFAQVAVPFPELDLKLSGQ